MSTPRRNRRRAFTALLVIVVAVGVGAVVVARRNASHTSSSGGSTPAPSSAGQAGGSTSLKPAITGIISEAGVPPARFVSVVHNFVVQADWAELQPDPGGPIAADNPIDQAIAQASAQHLNIKVRILAGIHAPEWAKEIGGPPITITDPVDHITGTIGRFWDEQYGAAYADLQNKLAAKYDNVPEIREVTVSRCTTVYAEPFIRDAGDADSRRALLAAGFSTAADQKCQTEEIDAHKVWAKTRSGVAFSVYQQILPDGSTTQNVSFTVQLMQYCRQELGPRCVLENNAIRSTSKVSPLFAAMRKLGPPISFQTAGPNRIGSLTQTLDFATSIGANAVETLTTVLPQASQLSALNSQLEQPASTP